MKIQMKTVYAGPAGTCPVGGEIEVDAEEGKALIDGGYATKVADGRSTKAPRKRKSSPVENAALSPAGEHTETAANPENLND